MAVSRKKVSSPKRKPKTSTGSDSSVPWHQTGIWLRDGFAWFLLVTVVVASLALISHGYGGAQENWMGPYLGSVLAQFLQVFLGRFPAVWLLLTLFLTALRLLTWGHWPQFHRVVGGMWSVFFFLSILLTLELADLPAHFQAYFVFGGGFSAHCGFGFWASSTPHGFYQSGGLLFLAMASGTRASFYSSTSHAHSFKTANRTRCSAS